MWLQEHCAAISGDVAVVQWFVTTFALAREKKLQDLAAKVEAEPEVCDFAHAIKTSCVKFYRSVPRSGKPA